MFLRINTNMIFQVCNFKGLLMQDFALRRSFTHSTIKKFISVLLLMVSFLQTTDTQYLSNINYYQINALNK